MYYLAAVKVTGVTVIKQYSAIVRRFAQHAAGQHLCGPVKQQAAVSAAVQQLQMLLRCMTIHSGIFV